MYNSDSILGMHSRSSDLMSESSSGSSYSERGINMDIVADVREDPVEELAESNLPQRIGYKWLLSTVTR